QVMATLLAVFTEFEREVLRAGLRRDRSGEERGPPRPGVDDWAAPRFLVHFKWEYVTTFALMLILSDESFLASSFPVTRSAELPRCRVPQRAVRPDRVVSPAEP